MVLISQFQYLIELFLLIFIGIPKRNGNIVLAWKFQSFFFSRLSRLNLHFSDTATQIVLLWSDRWLRNAGGKNVSQSPLTSDTRTHCNSRNINTASIHVSPWSSCSLQGLLVVLSSQLVTISGNCSPRKKNRLPASCLFCGSFITGAWLRWPGHGSGQQSQKKLLIMKMVIVLKQLNAVVFKSAVNCVGACCRSERVLKWKTIGFRWTAFHCTAETSCSQVVKYLHHVCLLHAVLFWFTASKINDMCYEKCEKCVCLNLVCGLLRNVNNSLSYCVNLKNSWIYPYY